MNFGILINLGLNKKFMQGSWITKETENIPKTKIYKWFKEKYDLKEGFQIGDSKKVPFLFNNKVAFDFYIERGFLTINIYNYPKNEWCFYPFNKINGMEVFDFKAYYEDISKNVIIDEVGSLEITKKLYYYIHLIDEFLANIILHGDFIKLKDDMKPMTKEQVEDINSMFQEYNV